MALVNNWDLKETNNAIYKEPGEEPRYVFSDLGATFGAAYSAEEVEGFAKVVQGRIADFEPALRAALSNAAICRPMVRLHFLTAVHGVRNTSRQMRAAPSGFRVPLSESLLPRK
jgi:hypothetical protein